MKGLTQMKSLADLKTPITTHTRSAPRREGTTYLEVFLLEKERQRLEMELAALATRQQRIAGRLEALREVIVERVSTAQQGAQAIFLPPVSPPPANPAYAEPGSFSGQWRTIPIEY